MRQEVGPQGLVAPDDEAADLFALEPLDAVLDLVEPRERLVGEAQELLAGAGERNARSQADEQLGSEALFQLLDDRRQARLAELKDPRGSGQASAPRDGLEV